MSPLAQTGGAPPEGQEGGQATRKAPIVPGFAPLALSRVHFPHETWGKIEGTSLFPELAPAVLHGLEHVGQVSGVLPGRGFRPDLLCFEHFWQRLAFQELRCRLSIALKALLPELRSFFLKLAACFDGLASGVASSSERLRKSLSRVGG